MTDVSNPLTPCDPSAPVASPVGGHGGIRPAVADDSDGQGFPDPRTGTVRSNAVSVGPSCGKPPYFGGSRKLLTGALVADWRQSTGSPVASSPAGDRAPGLRVRATLVPGSAPAQSPLCGVSHPCPRTREDFCTVPCDGQEGHLEARECPRTREDFCTVPWWL